jgi:hypothetical protein
MPVVSSTPAAEADEAEDLAAAAAVGTIADPAPREGAESGTWPDATAEAAFLGEARERGEVPVPAKAREEIAEETEARPLPALDDLMKRIPAEVRETLEDLFRAKFVRVVRVPKKALKR